MDVRGLSRSALFGARTQGSGGKKPVNETSDAQLVLATDTNQDGSQDPAIAHNPNRATPEPATVPEYEHEKTEDNLDEVQKKTLKKKKLKSKAADKIPQIKIRPPDEITKSAILYAPQATQEIQIPKKITPIPEKPEEVPDLGGLFAGMKLPPLKNTSKGNQISPAPGNELKPEPKASDRDLLGANDDPVTALLRDANIFELFGIDSRDAEAQALRNSSEEMRTKLTELIKAVEDIKLVLLDEQVKPLIHEKKTLEKLEPKPNAPASPRSGMSPQRPSGGNLFTSSTMRLNKAKKILNRGELDHFQKYLSIAFYLSVHFGFTTSKENLLPYVKKLFKELPATEPGGIINSTEFCVRFLKAIAELGEEDCLKLFLKSQKDISKLINESIRSTFFLNSRSDLMLLILEEYDHRLKAQKIKPNSVTMKILTASSLEMRSDDKLTKTWIVDKNLLDKDEDQDNPGSTKQSALRIHVDFIITTILQCTDENPLLLSILKNLGLSTATMLELLIDQKVEDKIIRISQEVPEFSSSLTKKIVLDNDLYKLLILFDKMELIELFNEPVIHPETRKTTSLYNKLCYLIESGQKVEGYCNVITNVSETFWDMEKLMVFFNALQKLIYGKNRSWLALILNPLLFFITLVKFFKDMKSQLDYRDNAITKLTEDIMNFCKSYINNSREESFLLNVFDRDSKNLGILDYALEIGDMNILESEPVESLISEMWNLNRHTMQNLSEFMRLDFVEDEIKKFNMSVFIREFDVTIEADDKFHLDFEFTSNSIRLKVISEIIWPLMAIIIELIFSLYLIYYFDIDKDGFDSEWYWQLYQDFPAVTIVHAFSRISLVISLALKTLALKHLLKNKSNYMAKFYNTLLFIAFLQMVVYPVFLWKDGNFMFLNITQMLFVLTYVAYISNNALSLNEVGVLLRILFRMTFVVLIFGTLSCIIITIIAYPIHTLYINFSQPIAGQLFPDLNLFDDLYQGILTLFEFTFGAVVFNRPYLQEDFYTYSMTFVMVIFSFFGNIMMANLLVAFLTSQFDQINRNAKYLTMNMQYELINSFNSKSLDSLVTLPYVFVIPVLPFYMAMIGNGSRRQKVNYMLRKMVHFVNVFLPAFAFLNIKLGCLWIWRYLMMAVSLTSKIPASPVHLLYLISWLVLGPLFLCKLLYQDNQTICTRLLNFRKNGEDLLNYELGDEARNNLVKIFGVINRVVAHELESNAGKETVTLGLNEFLSKLSSRSIMETLVTRANASKTLLLDRSSAPPSARDPNSEELAHFGKDFNLKYSTGKDRDIQEDILKRFASNEGKEVFLDLNFMHHKFRNNITVDKVDRLVSFEKDILDKASAFFEMEADTNLDDELNKLNMVVRSVNRQVELLTGKTNSLQAVVAQLDAAIPTIGDPDS